MPESRTRKKKAKGRPTPPPVKKDKGPSPLWYVVTMFGLMGAGVLLVVATYVFQMGNPYLFLGLGTLAVGFLMTTNYR